MKLLKANSATLYLLLIGILYYVLCYLFPITLPQFGIKEKG